MDNETRAHLDTALDALRQEIRAGAVETAALRQDMRETAEETRRHFDVVAESIERLGRELRAEVDSRFTGVHAVVGVALAEVRREIRGRGAGR